MKKGIILTLVGLLLVAFMAGCGGYRQTTVTEPTRAPHRAAPRDGVHRRDDGTYRRHDGNRAHDGVHHPYRRYDGHRAHDGVHRRHDGYRHDGRLTELYPSRSHGGRIGADGYRHYRDGAVTNRDSATVHGQNPQGGRIADGVGRGIWHNNNARNPEIVR